MWTKKSACNCNLDNMQSLLQVDDELDAEEVHPQLHHSESASSLQEVDSLSSELASSEQRQGTPKRDMTREEGRYKPPHMWPGCSPSDAAAAEQTTQVGLKTQKETEVAAAASSAAGWTGTCLCSETQSAAHKVTRSTATRMISGSSSMMVGSITIMTMSTLPGAGETCTRLTPVSSSSMDMRPLALTARWVPQGSQQAPRAMSGVQMNLGYQAAPLHQSSSNTSKRRMTIA